MKSSSISSRKIAFLPLPWPRDFSLPPFVSLCSRKVFAAWYVVSKLLPLIYFDEKVDEGVSFKLLTFTMGVMSFFWSVSNLCYLPVPPKSVKRLGWRLGMADWASGVLPKSASSFDMDKPAPRVLNWFSGVGAGSWFLKKWNTSAFPWISTSHWHTWDKWHMFLG